MYYNICSKFDFFNHNAFYYLLVNQSCYCMGLLIIKEIYLCLFFFIRNLLISFILLINEMNFFSKPFKDKLGNLLTTLPLIVSSNKKL